VARRHPPRSAKAPEDRIAKEICRIETEQERSKMGLAATRGQRAKEDMLLALLVHPTDGDSCEDSLGYVRYLR
jgi:hypothetical protein